MTNYKILTTEEITEALKSLPDWSLDDNKLKAGFTFKDFEQAFDFMSVLAPEFDRANHHPTWSNTYNKVQIEFSTHDVGAKITNLDIEMIELVSQAAESFK